MKSGFVELAGAAPEAAPDGSSIRPLLATTWGSLAHFTFPPGETSRAVRHVHVDELWYVIAGVGELWLGEDGEETVIPLRPGVAIRIVVGTAFQFRSADEELEVVLATMPPWTGPEEAEVATGPW